MFCDDCGHQLGPSGKCPICGWQKPMASQVPPMQQRPVQPQMNQPYGQQQRPVQPQMNQPYGQQQRPVQPQMNQPYGQQQRPVQPQMNQPQMQQPYGQQQRPVQPQMNRPQMQQPYGQQQRPVQPQMNRPQMQQPYGQQQRPMGQMQQPYNRPPVKPPAKSKKWPIFVGIGSGVVLIALAIFLIIKLNPVKDYTKDKTESQFTTNEFTFDTTENTSATTEQPIVVGDPGTKTIMVYIVGSNLESEGGAASDDIDEMLKSNFDDEKINLILYVGGSNQWYNDTIPANSNATLQVTNSGLKLLDSTASKNMADPNTLSDFINYAYSNFPADQYALILWDHGGGPLVGFGHDEVYGDMLSMNDIKSALRATPFNEDNKLEWLGFDACLMASLENAYIISPYAKYYVSSQESEPGWGWNYMFLPEIEDLSNGGEIGKVIVDYYIEDCEAYFQAYPYSQCDVTLSVMDLSKVPAAEMALDDLFEQANVNLSASSFREYSRARGTTKEIASQYTGDNSYDLVDLKNLCQKMNTLHPSESQQLISAIDDLVYYSRANEQNANGVCIYYTYNCKTYADYYLDLYDSLIFAPEYSSYIRNFTNLLTSSATVTANWDASTMYPTKNSDMTFSLQLTPEQMDECQNVYFVISRADLEKASNYVFVAMGNDVTIDSSNVVTANFDGNIIYMQNDTTNELSEIMYTIQEKTDTHTRYLISTILFDNDISEDEAMYAYFAMDVSPSNPGGELIGTYPISYLMQTTSSEGFSPSDLLPSRYEINIYDYNYIAFGSASHEFTSTEDLTNMNDADWSDVMITYTQQPVMEGFSTVSGGMQPGIPYFGMFIIEDVQGNRHCSNLVQLQ